MDSVIILHCAGCEPSLSHKRVLLLQPPGKSEESGSSGRVSVLLQSSVDLLKSMCSSVISLVPSPNSCDIEKTGIGLGTRLDLP
jgi:hypothetical protein